jgi:hypothetical protein
VYLYFPDEIIEAAGGETEQIVLRLWGRRRGEVGRTDVRLVHCVVPEAERAGTSTLSRVQSFLAEPAWADERQELGISVSAGQARVLSDSQDPSACQTLSKKFPDPEGMTRLFYKAGPYYFVIYERETQPDGDVTIGSPGFIVLDQNFEALRFHV